MPSRLDHHLQLLLVVVALLLIEIDYLFYDCFGINSRLGSGQVLSTGVMGTLRNDAWSSASSGRVGVGGRGNPSTNTPDTSGS